MFFFKRNNEQIQEIQHMLEKCNLNIKDYPQILYLICDYPHKHYTFKHFEV